jgi:hypothetical protein
LAELSAEVDAVTLPRLNDWIGGTMTGGWRDAMTVCTIGKSPLRTGGH